MNAHDIGPSFQFLQFVNFHDKSCRGKGLNPKEASAFSEVCSKGVAQLIECYKYHDRDLSAVDCREACSRCPFTFVPQPHRDILAKPNIFSPFFINDLFKDDVDLDNPKGFVYFITDGAAIKIGVATNIEKRLSSLQIGNCRELSLKYAIPFKSREAAVCAEARLHGLYREWRLRGEWFNLLDKLGPDWSLMFGTHWLSEEDAS